MSGLQNVVSGQASAAYCTKLEMSQWVIRGVSGICGQRLTTSVSRRKFSEFRAIFKQFARIINNFAQTVMALPM
jgi:hypothetical protein